MGTNINRKVVFVVGVLVLLSFVSAGLVGYLSNVVSGSVEVKGPVFYISGTSENEVLLINKEASCSGAPSITNRGIKVWETEDLDNLDFDYVFDVDFYVRASVNTGNGNLILNFSYKDSNDGVYEICSSNVTISSSSLSNYGPVSCNGLVVASDVKKFRYEIIGNCDNCIYTVSKCASGFNTKVEVSPI